MQSDVGPMVAIGIVVIGLLGVGGAFFLLGGRGPTAETVPVSSAPPPPPPPPATTPPPPPLSFVDQSLEKIFPEAETARAKVQQSLTAKDFAAARATCKDVAPKLLKLSGEPHPKIRAVVDGTRHLCDAEVPVAALNDALDKMPKSKPPKEACKAAVVFVDEIRAKNYQDDDGAKAALTRFGVICAP